MKDGMLRELEENILPFWAERMTDKVNGGFIGRISGDGTACSSADKGAILNARILWAFSAAYRITGKPEYLAAATRAKREITDKFYDRKFGGRRVFNPAEEQVMGISALRQHIPGFPQQIFIYQTDGF